MNRSDFLEKLQEEGRFQAQLEEKRVLPRQLDYVTSMVVRHTWEVVLLLAVLTSVFLEIVTIWK